MADQTYIRNGRVIRRTAGGSEIDMGPAPKPKAKAKPKSKKKSSSTQHHTTTTPTTRSATPATGSSYRPGQGAGATNGATPGTSRNQPATGKQVYGVDVMIGRQKPNAYVWWQTPNSNIPITEDLGKALQAVYGMGTDQVKKLQDRLVAAGVLSRKAITYGVADEDTVDAYQKILLRNGYTLQAGHYETVDETIDKAISAGPPSLDAQQGAPFSPQVSDPAEIKQALNEQLPGILGHTVSDAELNSLVAVYQSLQVKAQKSAYDTNISGGTSTQVVPIDVFAQQQAERLHPTDVQVKKLANTAKQFAQIISSSSPETATF